jgi:hypothetical protein
MANFAGEHNFITASILLIFNLIRALLGCAILCVLMLMRIAAKKMGGTWDSDVKLWYIRYGKIKGTELEKHMIPDAK